MPFIYNSRTRNRGWQFEDDIGYDLDHYIKICHSRYFRGGNDC